MDEVLRIPARRVVVIMPNWLGDAVMATPLLCALRGLYPGAHLAAVARPLAAAACTGLVDHVEVVNKGEEGGVSKWLRGEKFELGVLLPNSFRSAWMLWRGGVKARLGYARGGRSVLLNHRVAAVKKSEEQEWLDAGRRTAIKLLPQWDEICDGKLLHVDVRRQGVFVECQMRSTGKVVRRQQHVFPSEGGRGLLRMKSGVLQSKYQPVPAIEYYLELARYLGAREVSRHMVLQVSAEERAEAEGALRAMGLEKENEQEKEKGLGGGERYVVMVPGANFGGSKCWMPERYAGVATRMVEEFGVGVVLVGSASEAGVCEAIVAAVPEGVRGRVGVLSRLNGGKGVSVGALKEIVRRSVLMICNDTGPRHIAAAFNVPTVTLFGPTDPKWAETYSAVEKIVRVEVPCGPCQLKACPIDHRCMKGINAEMVMGAVRAVRGDTETRGQGDKEIGRGGGS